MVDSGSADKNGPDVLERLPWSKVARPLAITQDSMLSRQMALITNTVAFVGSQFFWIDDVWIIAYSALAMSFNMLTTWSVTSLTTNGHFLEWIDWIVTVVVFADKIDLASMARKA